VIGVEMKKLLELGDHYVSDFVKPDSQLRNNQKYSLDVYLDEATGAARLLNPPPAESMWGQYWYRSGINNSMITQLKEIVGEITSRVKLNDNDIWLDIACNDGTLLSFVPNNLIKLGIDPADDSYYNESSKVATKVVQQYFNYDAWMKTGYGTKKAKVITCIAMFYDLENPTPFIKDLYQVLDDDGVLVLQMSYTPLMLKQLAFDNICHEHVYYYSLSSIKKLFASQGFIIRDCSLNDTNGGSFRIYLQKNTSQASKFGTAPLRDVCNFRIDSLLKLEETDWNISNPEHWTRFGAQITQLKEQVLDFLHTAKSEGKTVYGYGASTKGNTLLQLFGIDNTLVTAIAERSPYKFGLRTVGTNIPIVSEEEMRAAKPDYLLVLPWHFINEFVSREQEFIASGGKLVVPCPRFEIIG
jgi:NDP-4-keto-2,6-dideoxyhexose 3-C-methyltransferase